MHIEQIYTGCLAQGAYFIASGKEALVIDPLRDTEAYLEKAREMGVEIKYVLETHFHADFVSGHLDLARKTGAKVVFGPLAQPLYEVHQAKDGERLPLGNISIEVLHTPGHTMESTCYLLRDESDEAKALFTGDTLFINDVGRPDLAVKGDLSEEDLAGHLYESIHHKILPLPDSLLVYPGHGAGSACGKNLGKETFDTLGHQKEVNYALNPTLSREDFIKEVTTGLMPPPAYFPENVRLNKQGYDSLEGIKDRGTTALSPEAFENLAEQHHALVLDTRSPEAFTASHIPGAISIGIDGQFAPWVGALIPSIDQPLLIVAEEGREEEVVTRLARVGYDQTLGYLKGGLAAWEKAGKETDRIQNVTASVMKELMARKPKIMDVRKPGEFVSSHLPSAQNTPLDYLNQHMDAFKAEGPFYLHCAGGYRSVIAASILKSRGVHDVVNILGGFKALEEAGLEVSDYVCPSTLKAEA